MVDDKIMDQIPEWFIGAKLNFAENLLWCRDPEKVALISTGTYVNSKQCYERNNLFIIAIIFSF